MSLLSKGKLIPLMDLLKARMSRVPTRVSAWRWTRYGSDGVVLEALRIGGSLMSTQAALDDFFNRLAEKKKSKPAPEKPASPAKRSTRTERRLKAAGLL
jgi:hypothetical protein